MLQYLHLNQTRYIMPKFIVNMDEVKKALRMHYMIDDDVDLVIEHEQQKENSLEDSKWIEMNPHWTSESAPSRAIRYGRVEIEFRDGSREIIDASDEFYDWSQEGFDLDIVKFRAT